MKIFKLKNKFNLKMSSNICHRCRIKSAELTCKACQTSLCFECDDFVHSSLKKNHFRERIKYNSFSELNTNFETNYNFYNNNSPSRFDNNFIEDDKEIDYNINQYNINNKSTVKKGSILQKKLNNISTISQDKLLNTCNSGFNIDEKYKITSYVNELQDNSANIDANTAKSYSIIFAFIVGVINLAKQKVNDKSEESSIVTDEYPLVMDAPLSSFDQRRIKNICEVIPNIARQVIIFIKDSDGNIAKKEMQAKIGTEYEVSLRDKEYPVDSKITKVGE